jgi:signal transduction histidine kinase
MFTDTIAIVVTGEGVIRDIIDCTAIGSSRACMGARFEELFEPAARGEASRFLREIAETGGAADWGLEVIGDLGPALRFCGTVLDDDLLVVGAAGPEALVNLFARLVQGQDGRSAQVGVLLRALLPWHGGRLPTNKTLEQISQISSELATMQRLLGQKCAALERENQVLGYAAHDLRGPVGVIAATVDLLLGGLPGPLTAVQHQLLARIDSHCRYMEALAADLLDLSTVESDHLQLELTEFDVCAAIRESVEDHEESAIRKSIRIDVTCARGLSIRADRRRIRQVFNNLLSNAVKFSPPGARVRVVGTSAGSWAHVTIIDRGPGIPPDVLPRLFEPFQRGTARGTAHEPSTGLGLAIVRRITDAHGGRVIVDTAPGRGAAFRVELPREPGGRALAEEPCGRA